MNSFFNCQTDEFETSTQDFTTQNFVKSVFIQLLFLCDGCMRITYPRGSQARVKGESVLFLGWRALFS